MRVLYLSQYFPPEVGATQERSYEMAAGLVRAGHRVTVLAEIPNHPSGVIPREYRGRWYERADLDGIDVARVWVRTARVKTFWTRLAFYASYAASAALVGIALTRERYDLVYATSPPLLVGAAALAISRVRRVPLVFEVRDLWPESAVALGELRNPAALGMAEWLERSCYRRAERIVVVTEGIRDRLVSRGVSGSRLALIPNGANVETFQPEPEAGAALRRELGLDGAFVALYAGVLGLSHDLDVVLDAAGRLRDRDDVRFLLVGEGPSKSALQRRAAREALPNVAFHPEVPRARMPAFLSMADVALVPLLRLAIFEGALPSKMFNAWACGCPTLLGMEGEARRVMEEAGAGVHVEPENPAALASAIEALCADRTRGAEMGERGRRFVREHYSREVQARELEVLLREVLTG